MRVPKPLTARRFVAGLLVPVIDIIGKSEFKYLINLEDKKTSLSASISISINRDEFLIYSSILSVHEMK